MEKEEKSKIILEKFAKENGKMSSPFCWMKNNYFSARHNRIVKNVKSGETIFQDFFFAKIFSRRRSNNEESKHNGKTHKEKTKLEEEVKRKNKENQ